MRLLRARRDEGYRIEDDPFVHVADDAEIPSEGDAIVGFVRWQRDRVVLAARPGRLGVRVPSDTRADELAPHAASFAVIAVEFPRFVDGRGYTIARLLRERHGYRGELRAVGNVLRDQLLAMARCGFTAFELDPSKRLEDALSAFDDFSVSYQPAADERLPLWKRQARAWPSGAPR